MTIDIQWSLNLSYSYLSYLCISQSVQILMVWAEEQVTEDGVAVTNYDVFIQHGRLDHRVHQELKENKEHVSVKSLSTNCKLQ